MLRPSDNLPSRKVLPDLAAFGISLALAWFLRWETADLVWSLWLSSLVTGYLTLLATLLGGALIGINILSHEDLSPRARLGLGTAGLAAGLFFLGFFSLHFCGFHAGHSVFLQARMHLLIFFFGFTQFIGLESFIVFMVVFSVYFFPWDLLKNKPPPRQQKGIL